MMAYLMDDLMDFQLIEHGKFIPKLEYFNVESVIKDVIETLNYQF